MRKQIEYYAESSVVLNPAIRKLLFLRFRGACRQRLRDAGSLKGIALLSVIALFVFVIMGSITSGQNTAVAESLSSAEIMTGNLLPLGLLLTCILTVLTTSGPALYFNQAEINLLFTAPMSRSSLVVYKIMCYASSAFLSATLLTLLLPKVAGSNLATLLAIFSTLLFVQLFSTAARMMLHVLSKRWHWVPSSKVVIILSLLSIILVSMYLIKTQADPIQSVLWLINSSVSSIILYPFNIVTSLHFSTTVFPEFTTLMSLTILMIVALVVAIIKMDEKLKEQSLLHSLQSQLKWQNIKKSGMLWQSELSETASLQAPPTLLRSYPMLWIQWLRLYRSHASAILFLAAIALILGPAIALSGSIVSTSTRGATLFFFCVFFIPRVLVFDFRGTLEYIELLKKLPVKPWRICISQLMLPIIVSSFLQLIIVLSAIPFVDNIQYQYIFILIALLIPFNFLLYLVENIIFLWFPARLVPVGRVDFDFLGRTLAEFLVKTIILSLAAVISLAVLVSCHQYVTHSLIVLGAALWLTPIMLGFALHLVLVRIFNRFDISKYALS